MGEVTEKIYCCDRGDNDNAANTTPITITLHPDAYARLTDEIITAATAKQINFVTTT